jgi:hypothetical protein
MCLGHREYLKERGFLSEETLAMTHRTLEGQTQRKILTPRKLHTHLLV